jgi:hypothetical protein
MQYTWLIWSLIFLLIWLMVYIFKKPFRKEMLKISLWTMPFGLAEPLFVPKYWNPPSIFNLAQNTGFDIESVILTFAMGGIASVLYKLTLKVNNEPFPEAERNNPKHKIHSYLLFTPVVVFLLFAFLTNLNHIYCASIAMFAGAVASVLCRPDLKKKIWVGGILFLLLYFIYFELLNVLFPGYVSAVWNFTDVSGILIFRVPLEELLFEFTFGMFWSGLYEHLFWFRVANKNQHTIHTQNISAKLDQT